MRSARIHRIAARSRVPGASGAKRESGGRAIVQGAGPKTVPGSGQSPVLGTRSAGIKPAGTGSAGSLPAPGRVIMFRDNRDRSAAQARLSKQIKQGKAKAEIISFPRVRPHPRPVPRPATPAVIQGGWFSVVTRYLRRKAGAAKRYAREKLRAARRWARAQLQKAKKFLAREAKHIPGYVFVTSLIGRNPVTNTPITRTVGKSLKTTLSFLGASEIFNNMVKSNVLQEAWTLIKTTFSQANLTGAFITGSLKKIWSTVTVNPLSWTEAIKQFGTFIATLTTRALTVGKTIIPGLSGLVLKGFLVLVGAPAEKIMAILGRGRGVIRKIAASPGAFAGNLIRAVKKGVFQFKDNIWKHLKIGFFTWLTASLAGNAGLELPEKFNLKGIFSLVMQVLGLGYALFRKLMVGVIGEKNMVLVEKGFTLVKTLMTGKVTAFWDMLKGKMGEIRDEVVQAIQKWVVTKIISTGVVKLLTLLAGPFGAVLEAVKTVYKFVLFFIERANQLAALMGIIFNSISDIAAGKLASAANFIEKSMGLSISLILHCLSRLLEITGITAVVTGFIRNTREKVEKTMASGVNAVAPRVKAWLSRLTPLGGSRRQKDPAKEAKRQSRAKGNVVRAVNRMTGPRRTLFGRKRTLVTKDRVLSLLARQKQKYGFSTLDIIPAKEPWRVIVRAGFSPTSEHEAGDTAFDRGQSGPGSGSREKAVAFLDSQLNSLPGQTVFLGKQNRKVVERKQVRELVARLNSGFGPKGRGPGKDCGIVRLKLLEHSEKEQRELFKEGQGWEVNIEVKPVKGKPFKYMPNNLAFGVKRENAPGEGPFQLGRSAMRFNIVARMLKTQLPGDVILQRTAQSGDRYGIATALALNTLKEGRGKTNVSVLLLSPGGLQGAGEFMRFYEKVMDNVGGDRRRIGALAIKDMRLHASGDDDAATGTIYQFLSNNPSSSKTFLSGKLENNHLEKGPVISASATPHEVSIGTRKVADAIGKAGWEAVSRLARQGFRTGNKEGDPKGEEKAGRFLMKKAIRKKGRYTLMWIKAGSWEDEKAWHYTSNELILFICRESSGQARNPVLMGDAAGKRPDKTIDLRAFWKDPAYPRHLRRAGRMGQMAVLRWFADHTDSIAMGMRSGILEANAISGIPTFYFEERGAGTASRMERWLSAIPHFHRIILELPPGKEQIEAFKREIETGDALFSKGMGQKFGDRINEVKKTIRDRWMQKIEQLRGNFDITPLEKAAIGFVLKHNKSGLKKLSRLLKKDMNQYLTDIFSSLNKIAPHLFRRSDEP